MKRKLLDNRRKVEAKKGNCTISRMRTNFKSMEFLEEKSINCIHEKPNLSKEHLAFRKEINIPLYCCKCGKEFDC